MSVESFPEWANHAEYDQLYYLLLSKLPEIESWFTGRVPDLWSVEKNEQHLIIAVCRLTGLAPSDWNKLSKPERCPWLETAISELACGDPLEDAALMTHLEIAERMSLDAEKLRNRLDRWRRKNMGNDGWQEVTDPKPRQPKYLYRIGAVRDVLNKAVADQERARQAPA